MNKQQQGFTLVELIVVIIILGILAATALPRFIDVTGEARTASVQGFAGGLRAGVGMAQARYFADGSSGSTSILMADTTTIAVASGTGLPLATASGIGHAIAGTGGCPAGTGTCQGFTALFGGGSATFRPTNGGSTTCQASYAESTGIVTVSSGGCP